MRGDRTAIDLAHVALLVGTVMAAKPQHVLELGVGTGYASWAVLHALAYNGRGRLTCVDSCKDFGREPAHFSDLRAAGVDIAIETEEAFTKRQVEGAFDFLISDADHGHALDWLDDTLRILGPAAQCFSMTSATYRT